MIKVSLKHKPKLDDRFIPAKLWNEHYKKLANSTAGKRGIRIAMERPDGCRWVTETALLPQSASGDPLTFYYCERLIKFLLWAWGGHRIRISGAPDVVSVLQKLYSSEGKRSFDYKFLGETCFDQAFSIENANEDDLTESHPASSAGSGALSGNRIGFDLGGSDRKCAALIDGEVVFSEEVKWSPYFETDPDYHQSGIEDSIRRAAAHLPHVDAIGGSSAGIHIENEPRVGSLYRGLSTEDFKRSIRPIFKNIQKKWDNVPFEIVNDGDVTAMAGAMAINDNSVLGISMGTSQAGGYIDPNGKITGWLNELAFAPIDYQKHAAIDEWSGDHGCGVQYFSQQAVGRLIPLSGLTVSDEIGLPEKLEIVQEKIKQGDQRAAAIYSTIGTYFGYSIAHYADFYDFRNLLVLGRVSSGHGGTIILDEARKVLDSEFPELSEQVRFQTPDEQTKRHGQAIAAASLPSIA